MKTLLILRHAKSSWKSNRGDHDRPLNDRGKRDAPRVGKLLKQSGLAPDRILSSTAKRARKTAAKVAKKCQYEGVLELKGSLYLGAPEDYIQVLREVEDVADCVMVVGHNPGLEQLLSLLTGEVQSLPTAALAQVALEVDTWQELRLSRRGELIHVWRPKELD